MLFYIQSVNQVISEVCQFFLSNSPSADTSTMTAESSNTPTDGDDNTILIESFKDPKFSWHSKNDPVMGGESQATVSIRDGLGIFDGEVVDVPFLRAPGFITMESIGGDYPDVSSCDALQLTLRSSVSYGGYRVSFGNARVPGNRYARGYKANFDVMPGSAMTTIEIPFRDFTARWDDATGDQIVTCEENEDFCPDVKTLRDMNRFAFWGEGVSGKVHLEIESIAASGCGSAGNSNTIMNMNNMQGILIISFSIVTVLAFVIGVLFCSKKREGEKKIYSTVKIAQANSIV